MINRIRGVLLVTLLTVAVGCAEYRGLQSTGEIPRDLSIGDKIQVTLKDDQHFEFVVVDITNRSIVGEHVNIEFKEILSIKKKEINKLKTTGAIAGGTIYVFLVGLMLYALIVL